MVSAWWCVGTFTAHNNDGGLHVEKQLYSFPAWSSPQHILRLHRSKQSHFGMLYLERAAPARQDKIALLLFWKTNDLTANGCLLIQTEFSHLAYRGIFKPLRCVVLLCINRLQIRDSVGLLAPCVQHSKWLLLSSSSNQILSSEQVSNLNTWVQRISPN